MKKLLLLSILAIGSLTFTANARGAANRALNFQLRETSSILTDYRVEIPNTLIDTDSKSFTMAAWFCVEEFKSVFPVTDANKTINQGIILGQHNRAVSTTTSGSFLLGYDLDGNIVVRTDKNNAQITSDAKIKPGEWAYVAYAYDEPTNRGIIYLNGKQVAFGYGKNSSFTWESTDPVIVLGDQNFNGDIDEFQYFNRVLTNEEMELAYNNRPDLVEGLVALYDFNEPVEGYVATFANKATDSAKASINATYYKNEYGSSMRGLYSRKSSEEVQPVYTVGRALPAEYCTIEGNYAYSTDDRLTTALNFTSNNGREYELNGLQSASDKSLYLDRTASVVSFTRGETVTLRAANNGEWMHCYAYIDLDRDGDFVPELDESTLAVLPGSELLAFNCYSSQCYEIEKDGNKPSSDLEETTYRNSLGESVGASGRPSDALTFTLPETMRPGDYRLRFKVDWNNIDPCGHPDQTAQTLAANGGCIVDVTLRIVKPAHDIARQITLHSSDEKLGTVRFEGFKASTITTDENVTIIAEPVDADAYLYNWTDKDGNEVGRLDNFVYDKEEGNELTGNFRQHYQITVDDEDGKVSMRMPLGVVNSGDYVDKGTQLTVSCSCLNKTLSELWINDENVFDQYDNGYTFTVDKTIVIRPVYVSPIWTMSIASQGCGTVVVATDFDEYSNEPAGEIFTDGSEIEDGTFFYIFAIPGEGEEVTSLNVDGDDYDKDSLEVTLCSDGTYIMEYAALDDVNISVVFTENTAAIDAVEVADPRARYFNLQGIEVNASALDPGLYICRSADKTFKVVKR